MHIPKHLLNNPVFNPPRHQSTANAHIKPKSKIVLNKHGYRVLKGSTHDNRPLRTKSKQKEVEDLLSILALKP